MSRFSKTDNFKGVPHPLTGDYTPKPQEEIDDSLYVYGKKGPQKPEISDSADNSTEHSTCQSNDSEGSFRNPSEHSSESESESISVPNEMSTSKSVTANEKVMSESKEVEPSCVTHVKTPRKQMKNQETHEVKRKNWNEMMGRELGEGYSFIKKKCFVCGSLSHLIKDCDYYEKKMAREAELKKQRVFNTGNGVAKPVWTNANRDNVHSIRHNIKFCRPPMFNTGRVNVNSVKSNVNSVRHNVNSARTNVTTGRSKQPVPTCNSNSFSLVKPQGNWGTSVKTSAGYNWRRPRPNSNYNSGSNFVRTDHPLKNMEDRGIFDSGCSWHMTGKKDHLDDFEECKGGSVTFGGSESYITGPVDQAEDQPSSSEPLPSTSHPTPVPEPTTHPTSPLPEPDNEYTEHTFEQPSTEHQPLSPRQEPKAPQSHDPTHPHVSEDRALTVEDLLHMVPTLITKVDSLEIELKKTKQTMGKAIVKLVKKVKKLENILKRRNVVLTTSEDEEPEDQGRIF
ncbi:hypothetical protein Tco_1417198 [Tanacetum coccineum]